MLFAEALAHHGSEIGERDAFVAADWSITYRTLDRISDELAVALSRRGIGIGTVVALSMPSNIDFAAAYAALTKLGACAVGVNPALTERERREALQIVGPDYAIATDDLAAGIDAAVGVIAATTADAPDAVFASLRSAARGERPAPLPPDPERPVTICFTSGSSGTPKGVLFREKQIRAIAQLDTGRSTVGASGGAGSGGWGQGSHTIIATQFAHVGGMTKIPWMVASGGTLHVLPRWRAADVLRLTERFRMPTVNAGPTQVGLMLRSPDFDSYDLTSVQAIIAGTAPSNPSLIVEARERFRAAYSSRYSSTECGGVGIAVALDAPDSEALYTVGRPRPGVDAKVADDDGRELPRGEVGEVWLRSAAVMSEYVNDPGATATTLVGGWLRTGDLGVHDDTGCYRIVGRRKEMFIRGGYNVYPVEVENVLAGHPGVASIAVVPQSDAVMGEIGVAFVVAADPGAPPTLEQLREFGAGALARYKLPERFQLVDELPLNATHKLDRRALAARLVANPSETQ